MIVCMLTSFSKNTVPEVVPPGTILGNLKLPAIQVPGYQLSYHINSPFSGYALAHVYRLENPEDEFRWIDPSMPERSPSWTRLYIYLRKCSLAVFDETIVYHQVIDSFVLSSMFRNKNQSDCDKIFYDAFIKPMWFKLHMQLLETRGQINQKPIKDWLDEA